MDYFYHFISSEWTLPFDTVKINTRIYFSLWLSVLVPNLEPLEVRVKVFGSITVNEIIKLVKDQNDL